MKLDSLRLFVDQRLSAATDDIFRRFARIIADYDGEVCRLKEEIDRKERLLVAAGRPEDRRTFVQSSTTEEEQQVRKRFKPSFKQEEGGASQAEGADTLIPQSPDWLRESSEQHQSPSSSENQSCDEEAVPKQSVDKEEVLFVKEEMGGYLMREAASESSSPLDAVLQIKTTEEEQQSQGRSSSLHVKQEEGGVSGPEETVDKLTHIPDWLMESYEEDGSHSSNQIHFHRDEGLFHPDHSVDLVPQPESDSLQEPGLQMGVRPEALPPPVQDLLVCVSCGREFSSKKTLSKHIRRYTSPDQDQMSCSRHRKWAPFQTPAKSFNCRICDASFSTLGILVRHAENHCKEPDSWCGACGDYLESTESLRDHLRSHKELGSTCDVCGKKCSSIKRMEIHRRVHTGEKPYSCGFCSRDFSRKESLERHLQIHSGDRPHSCGLCWRTFTRREYLVQHLRTGHTETPGPPAETQPPHMKLN
ncbi:zinc finger and SCAN domain-containing protein 2-like [Antennarius striatus]|uniref:zinc finger and SCAN domain-containing protein 2-like n=1 Tax=Antennarius striatus TaxID=241820 RepID=UPI0035AE9748